MTRRSAWEISKANARLNIPFYRFPITQSGKSDQHAMLLELDDGTNEVFYAAPRFHELAQINQAWSAQEVAARSIFVRPERLAFWMQRRITSRTTAIGRIFVPIQNRWNS